MFPKADASGLLLFWLGKSPQCSNVVMWSWSTCWMCSGYESSDGRTCMCVVCMRGMHERCALGARHVCVCVYDACVYV